MKNATVTEAQIITQGGANDNCSSSGACSCNAAVHSITKVSGNMENAPLAKAQPTHGEATESLATEAGAPSNTDVDSTSKLQRNVENSTVTKTTHVKQGEASENWSPSNIALEKVLNSKSPTLRSVGLPKQLPFRERNSEEGKRVLPPHIKVPPKKLFGYPERYRSPTDMMVSPVSRGLLTRNRRPARTLAPAVPPKALENTFQDLVVDVADSESN